MSLRDWETMMSPDEFDERARERRRRQTRTDWLSLVGTIVSVALWAGIFATLAWGWAT
jgi:hypothetical protein